MRIFAQLWRRELGLLSVRRRLAISNENFIIANEFQIVSKKSDDLAKKCILNFFVCKSLFNFDEILLNINSKLKIALQIL